MDNPMAVTIPIKASAVTKQTAAENKDAIIIQIQAPAAAKQVAMEKVPAIRRRTSKKHLLM
jgi:hypothetical protein